MRLVRSGAASRASFSSDHLALVVCRQRGLGTDRFGGIAGVGLAILVAFDWQQFLSLSAVVLVIVLFWLLTHRGK